MASHVPSAISPAEAEHWLSGPRYRRYLSVASGDHDQALRVYVWNSRVAAAGAADVGHLEVALRNAYDRELIRRFPDWAIDPANRLFQLEQGVAKARQQQRRRNQTSTLRLAEARRGLSSTPTHAEVVAVLTFGFWANLTVGERTSTLWNPMLNRAFPKGTSRATVHDLVQRVVKFRNRLAHNEPVFSTRTGLDSRLTDVASLFRLVDPAALDFAVQHSSLPSVLAACPIPGLTSATGLR